MKIKADFQPAAAEIRGFFTSTDSKHKLLKTLHCCKKSRCNWMCLCLQQQPRITQRTSYCRIQTAALICKVTLSVLSSPVCFLVKKRQNRSRTRMEITVQIVGCDSAVSDLNRSQMSTTGCQRQSMKNEPRFFF